MQPAHPHRRPIALAVGAALLAATAVGGAPAAPETGSYLVVLAADTRWDAWRDALAAATVGPERADAGSAGGGHRSDVGMGAGPADGMDLGVDAGVRAGMDARMDAGSAVGMGTGMDAGMRTRTSAAARAAGVAAARVARMSEPVASAVTAMGGTVVARYDTALPGLLVHVSAPVAVRLAALPGVARVAPAPIAVATLLDRRMTPARPAPALQDSVPGIGADRARQELGVDGSGVTVGVIDTGIDYTHGAFGGPGTEGAYAAAGKDAEHVDDTWLGTPLYPTARVVGGFDFAGPLYSPDCTAAGERQGACSSRPAPDPDPLDIHGHGTHVAGIAAGGAVEALGDGVAPGASLVALKIFGSSGLTDLIVDPLEWAIQANMGLDDRPHIDVLNISLGQRYGAELLDEAGAVRRAVEAGIVVVASAGNDSYLPFIASAPGIAPDAIAVASYDPPGQLAWTGRLEPIGAETIEYGATALFLQAWSPSPRSTLAAQVVYVGRGCPGDGGQDPTDPYLADPAGRIALVELSWGSGGASCTADRQARRAQGAGAVAVLIGMGLGIEQAARWDGSPIVDVPVWTVGQDMALSIRESSPPERPGILTLVPEPLNAQTGVISEFSSRGPARTGQLKPDLAAPGAGIFSAAVGQGRRGIALSGTSMAAPHASGTAALVWERARDQGRSLTARDVASLLVTTADPAALHQTADRPDAPPLARGGAGGLDALAATGSGTVVRAGAIADLSLGVTALVEPIVRTIPISVTNTTGEPRRYRLEPRFRMDSDVGRGLGIAPSAREIAVAPGASESATISATITPAQLRPWSLLGGAEVGNVDELAAAELDGWLEVTDASDAAGPIVQRLPFYLLARRASAIAADWPDAVDGPNWDVELNNSSPFDGAAEVYELAGIDPPDPTLPGKIDLDAVGVRTAPDGQGNTVLSFALHARGARMHPLETDAVIELDTDFDGRVDYVAYTVDEEYLRTKVRYNGRVRTALERSDGGAFGAVAPYYAVVDLNGAFTVLPILAEDTGLTPSTLAFRFRVTMRDFVDRDVARMPQADALPDSGWLTFDARGRERVPDVDRVEVPGGTGLTITLVRPAEDSGYLVLFPSNVPGPGDAAIRRGGEPPTALAVPYLARHALWP